MPRLIASVAPEVKTSSPGSHPSKPATDLRASLPLVGFPAKGMGAAGCVAEFLVEIGEHPFQDTGINRAGGIVIKVDPGVYIGLGFQRNGIL